MGTRTFCMCSPFGRVQSDRISPTGSGSSATSSMARAMAAIPSLSSFSRWSIGLLVPFFSAFFKSCALASMIAFSECRISFAIARRMSFFCPVPSFTSSREAARARRPISRMRSWMVADMTGGQYAASCAAYKRGAEFTRRPRCCGRIRGRAARRSCTRKARLRQGAW